MCDAVLSDECLPEFRGNSVCSFVYGCSSPMYSVPVHTISAQQNTASCRYRTATDGEQLRAGADKFLARPGSNKLQRTNSGFIQRTPHEAQYTS